jgi:hypothetical protein
MKTTTSTRKAKSAKTASRKHAESTPARAAKKSPSIATQLRELRESVDALNLHADNLLKQLL